MTEKIINTAAIKTPRELVGDPIKVLPSDTEHKITASDDVLDRAVANANTILAAQEAEEEIDFDQTPDEAAGMLTFEIVDSLVQLLELPAERILDETLLSMKKSFSNIGLPGLLDTVNTMFGRKQEVFEAWADESGHGDFLRAYDDDSPEDLQKWTQIRSEFEQAHA